MRKIAQISFDVDTLARIDRFAQSLGMNRTAFVTAACNDYIAAREKLPELAQQMQRYTDVLAKAASGQMDLFEASAQLDAVSKSVESGRVDG